MSAAQPVGGRSSVVAADVGGTDIKLGVFREGVLTDVRTVPTPLDDGPGALVDALAAELTAGLAEDVAGFGVAVPGIVSDGVVHHASNLGWNEVPLQRLLSARLGLPGAVGHDVRCAGLAEWRTGPHADADDLLFLALGTGIAAAVIVDAHPLIAGGFAGEIGHIRVGAAAGRPCGCGQTGCLETVASARGVRRSYAAALGRDTDASPTTAAIADLARAGDPHAVAAFDRAVDGLTEALRVAVTLLGPAYIVLGGGLALSADLVIEPVQQRLDAQLTFQRRPRLSGATLGARAGLLGAALLGAHTLDDRRAP